MYKRIPAILMLGRGEPCDGLAFHPGGRGVKFLHATETRIKLQLDGPLGSYADLT